MNPARTSSADARAKAEDSASVVKGLKIQAIGRTVLRYGLVAVLAWIGAMKFTGYEAKGIEPLIAHSPFMGWMYRFLTLQQVSNGLGVVEIGMAVSIALGPWSAKLGAFGSAVAVLTFLTTLTFLFSTLRVIRCPSIEILQRHDLVRRARDDRPGDADHRHSRMRYRSEAHGRPVMQIRFRRQPLY